MANLENKRVVITGMGAKTLSGSTLSEYWQGLSSGRNGVGSIAAFDASKHASRMIGEVKRLNPINHIDKEEARCMDRFTQFAVVASKQPLKDAHLGINPLNAEQLGVSIGAGANGIRVVENQQRSRWIRH